MCLRPANIRSQGIHYLAHPQVFKGHIVATASNWFASFLVSHQSDQQFLRKRYFNKWSWKNEGQGLKVRGEVKGQCHIVDPVSNRCTTFCLMSMRPIMAEIWPKECWPDKKTKKLMCFERKNWQKNISNRIPLKINQVIRMTRGI